jgi:hypothetical protein
MLIKADELSLLVTSLTNAKEAAKQHADDCEAVAKRYNVDKAVIRKIALCDYNDAMDKLRKTVRQFDGLLNQDQMSMEFDGTGAISAAQAIRRAKGGDGHPEH